MRLSGLLPLFDESPSIRRLVDLAGVALPPSALDSDLTIDGSPALMAPQVSAVVREAAKATVIASLQARSGRPIVLLASDPAKAQAWVHDLQTWSQSPDDVHYLPAFDAAPYEQLPAAADTVGSRTLPVRVRREYRLIRR